MHSPTRPHPPLLCATRQLRCLWCREPLRLGLAVKHHALCARCRAEAAAAGWRLIYDRDRRIGAIPHNLRAAYNL
jgi:hypothetical protein